MNVVAVVKLSDNLDVEWSEMYGMAGGHSQMFDLLVDNEGNYLMGGHTTVGEGTFILLLIMCLARLLNPITD